MNHAGEVASGGHLHEALLLPKIAEGLSQQDHVSEDRAPLLRGVDYHTFVSISIQNMDTFYHISLHTTTLERKAGETYLTLSGLAPPPR